MENNTQMLPINLLEVNKGQIDGLPKNPRFIRDDRFAALVKSIKDAPEMLHLRELLVVKHGKKYVTIGGNMRLRACQELGYEEVPCKVLAEDTPTAKLREYAIKDNNGFGQDDWDILANDWDAGELQDWGMELPMSWDEDVEPTDLDDDRQDKAFCCKITFDNQDKLNEFMQRYESLIADEFSCTISVSGGKL